MKENLRLNKEKSPWWWIPSLYVAEGLPYFAVNTLTVLMYVNMGIDIGTMAFFTGWLYLPWVIKPFWSPFIDIFKTKRWWILTMQLLMGISMAAIALLLPGSFFFTSTLIVFWLIAFFSATHDVAADGFYILGLSSHEQASFVGVRSTFYRVASIAGQGGLVMLAGYWETSTGNIPVAWSYVFGILSLFFLGITFYHWFAIPKTKEDQPRKDVTYKNIFKDFLSTFSTFFKKPHIIIALAFMLLYRFPEALCVKLVQPFLVASKDIGGLGLSTTEAGFINGTVGVIGLLLGGIAGGVAIAKWGLKRMLWLMAGSLTLPCIFYCFLAMWQPESFHTIAIAIGLEQFGYGFGFSAYMLYLIYFSRGENATSHYAFCTAFMAIGMMIPGMFAGWLQEWLQNYDFFATGTPQGFVNFFWVVVLSSLVTFLVCSFLKINPSFGMKDGKEEDYEEDNNFTSSKPNKSPLTSSSTN